jgi:hypothetical protein
MPDGRRCLLLLLAWTLLAAQALATWSIVVVNRRTGEICIASATCLENFNLRNGIGVMASEIGAGATQSFAVSSFTRKRIHDMMLEGVPPQEILDAIAIGDGLWASRQIGLVDMAGRAVSYSGASCGPWFGGVTGVQGDYVYAIQGNVLTGSPVVDQCEAAFLATGGDLGQKVMAAMEAAMLMGGDGRCSCSPQFPEQCGAPPPNFTKSAHVAFFLIGRPGEEEICTNNGCAGGDFYLAFNKASLGAADPDPVLLLRQDYDAWRIALQGRPDAMHSTVWPADARVPAAGGAPLLYELDLADVEGQPVGQGGAAITLVHDPRSAGLATLGQVTDHLDGTYTVEVLPGAGVGTDLLRFVVDDGIHAVTLWPPARLLHDPGPSAPLLAGAPPAGLGGLAQPRAVHLSRDRLTAWAVAASGGSPQLFTMTRALPDAPFGAPSPVDLGGFPLAKVGDLCVSADGLRVIFSAGGPGPQRLWSASRASAAVGFDAPTLIADLDGGAGDMHPALSPDERELIFASARSGGWDLWRARRLSPTARFFPPERIAALSLPNADEFAPEFDAGGARLWFARRAPSSPSVTMTAALQPAGEFAPALPAPGVHGAGERAPVAAEAGEGPIWFLTSAGGGTALEARARAVGTLAADADLISAAQGGIVTFALDAGPAWSGAAYRLTLGAPGVTVLAGGSVVLPFDRDARLDAWLQDPANAALLPGFRGALDAQGRASAQWVLPAGALVNSVLLGRTFAVAYVAVRAGDRLLSATVPLTLIP